MPKKTYDICTALLSMQPGAEVDVIENDSDQITYRTWTGPQPTETELDAAGQAVMDNDAQIAAAASDARTAIAGGPPAQSLPAIVDRVTAIEAVLREAGMLD